VGKSVVYPKFKFPSLEDNIAIVELVENGEKLKREFCITIINTHANGSKFTELLKKKFIRFLILLDE
jgi:hypothetical protein